MKSTTTPRAAHLASILHSYVAASPAAARQVDFVPGASPGWCLAAAGITQRVLAGFGFE